MNDWYENMASQTTDFDADTVSLMNFVRPFFDMMRQLGPEEKSIHMLSHV